MPVDAHQPGDAFTVRVDAVSHPSGDLFEGRDLPVRFVGSEAFKFWVIRIGGTDLPDTDYTDDLDHLINERSQFIQEHLVAINDLQELTLLQYVFVELLQTLLEIQVQTVNAGRIEGTPLPLFLNMLLEKDKIKKRPRTWKRHLGQGTKNWFRPLPFRSRTSRILLNARSALKGLRKVGRHLYRSI